MSGKPDSYHPPLIVDIAFTNVNSDELLGEGTRVYYILLEDLQLRGM